MKRDPFRFALAALLFALALSVAGCGGGGEVREPKLDPNAPKLQPKTVGGAGGPAAGKTGSQ